MDVSWQARKQRADDRFKPGWEAIFTENYVKKRPPAETEGRLENETHEEGESALFLVVNHGGRSLCGTDFLELG
jgi:hypothetical protein